MKKKISIWIAVVFVFTLVLTACGEKSQESVVDKISDTVDSMKSYKVKAEMNMATGQEEQKYQIDIWHKEEDFYRVALTNDQDEKGSQVILKNKDGVFVHTPALNKSFRFQTEWPENSSQPYLLESVVSDVQNDKDAVFTVTDSHYIFKTKTNYQSNNNLPFQEIYFDKKSYTPVLVKVLDKDENALVEVKFASFEKNPNLKEDDFEMKEEKTSEKETDVSVLAEQSSDPFAVVFPLNTVGSELAEKKEVTFDDGQRVIMTFTGEKQFTLVQEKLDVIPTISSPQEVKGDIVNLGYTIGALSENAIEWTYNGVDFQLASEDLTKEELIEVAQSVQGKEVK